jgi:hypothetical protein
VNPQDLYTGKLLQNKKIISSLVTVGLKSIGKQALQGKLFI